MSHLDPDFQRVLGIFCLNEPHRNTTETPGLGKYYADFITTVRVVEYALGIDCNVDLHPALQRMSASNNVIPGILAAIPILPSYAAKANPPLNVTKLTGLLEGYCHDSGNLSTSTNLINSGQDSSYGESISTSLIDTVNPSAQAASDGKFDYDSSADSQALAVPCPPENDTSLHMAMQAHRRRRDTTLRFHSKRSTLYRSGSSYEISPSEMSEQGHRRSCLTTVAMPKKWQWQNDSESMAPHVLGPRAYDDHLYFSFGGVANASYESYLDTICSMDRYEAAQNNSEVPYGHGEYSLATNFNSSHSELMGWGDAQKYSYGKESFWTFWTFRMEDPENVQWSYLQALNKGILTNDPAHFFNASICVGREKKKDGAP